MADRPPIRESYTAGAFGRFIAWLGTLACLAALVYGALTHGPARNSASSFVMAYGLPVLGLAVSGILFRLRAGRRDALALAMASTVFSIYAVEGVLWVLEKPESAEARQCRAAGASSLGVMAVRNCILAREQGLDFDMRSRLDVVEDLETERRPAVPAASPKYILRDLDNWPVLPLGAISRSTTIYCNETGEFVVYESDEHGFRNPTDLWTSKGGVALIGDSFTQGSCVPEDASLAGLVRARVPQTLNLGMNGFGPLLALASIREFLVAVEPRVVYWQFYEGNDFANLEESKAFGPLRAYLEAGYRQDLLDRQDEIDARWRAYVEEQRSQAVAARERNQASPQPRRRSGLRGFALLRRGRELVGSVFQKEQLGDGFPDNWDLLATVATEAKQTVDSWGGRLVVVYMPTWGRFARPDLELPPRDRALALFSDIGIEVIDGTVAFADRGDPLSLWPFRVYGHYSAEGYRVIGDLILSDLRRVGIVSN